MRVLGKFIFGILIVLLFCTQEVRALDCGQDIPTGENDLKDYIASCNARISDSQGQQKTLASTISYLNNQISLTTAQIKSTEVELQNLTAEIADLSVKISGLNTSLTDLTKLFATRVRATYKNTTQNIFTSMLQSVGVSDLLERLEYLSRVRDNDQKMLVALEKNRLDYDSQKTLKTKKQDEYVALQTKLNQQNSSLLAQKQSKNSLLAATKNDEAKYQSLMSAAKSQLAAFHRFVTTQGGATILNNQTRCNDWGCYYNQRDSQWGNRTIGLSNESMSEVGCLVTSMAMIASHYHKTLTPGDIAGSSSPFLGSTAYMNLGGWTVNGVTLTRARIGSSTSQIDAELAAGRPVVVGIYGGPDHFLVITGKDGSDYIMNDPYVENGGGIKFSSHYSLSAITAVDRVTTD